MSYLQSKPTAAPADPVIAHYVVGQDPQGRWLAVESHNLGGGLFKSLQDALHFVGLETGHRPGAVERATAPLQLKF